MSVSAVREAGTLRTTLALARLPLRANSSRRRFRIHAKPEAALIACLATFVNIPDFFHFSGIEKFSATLVPVDGQGPTYVERGAVAHHNETARIVSTGFDLVQTNVNNDRFFGYVDGKLVASATIRIHELEHFVGADTDGDNIPDTFKVSVTIDRVSCPT